MEISKIIAMFAQSVALCSNLRRDINDYSDSCRTLATHLTNIAKNIAYIGIWVLGITVCYFI